MFKSYKIKKIFYVLSLGNINMCLFIGIVSTVRALSHIVSSLEMNEEINQLILSRIYFLES